MCGFVSDTCLKQFKIRARRRRGHFGAVEMNFLLIRLTICVDWLGTIVIVCVLDLPFGKLFGVDFF